MQGFTLVDFDLCFKNGEYCFTVLSDGVGR